MRPAHLLDPAFLIAVGLVLALALLGRLGARVAKNSSRGAKIQIRAGLLVLTLTTAAYWVLASPVGSVGLIRQAAGPTPNLRAALKDVPVEQRGLVVLGGGMRQTDPALWPAEALGPATLMRCLGAARLAKQHEFGTIVLSGTHVETPPTMMTQGMADVLMQYGVARERLFLEPWSRDTQENAELSALILRARGIRRVVVATSDVHLRRSVEAFREVGLDAVGAVVALDGEAPSGVSGLLPSSRALFRSHRALHEIFGRLEPSWADRTPRFEGGIPSDFDPEAPPRALPLLRAGPLEDE